MDFLGLDPEVYPHTFFPTVGPVKDVGLSTPAISLQFGKSEIYNQDQSIMGWTCGFAIASARDVARFYFDLLGPDKKIVSEELVAEMQKFSRLDVGWSHDFIDYGGGLFVINAGSRKKNYKCPSLNLKGTYVGHEGDTYGFQSTQGYFHHLNASMSLIVNVDFDYRFPDDLMCKIVDIVFKYKGIRENQHCEQKIKKPEFYCQVLNDEPTC